MVELTNFPLTFHLDVSSDHGVPLSALCVANEKLHVLW